MKKSLFWIFATFPFILQLLQILYNTAKSKKKSKLHILGKCTKSNNSISQVGKIGYAWRTHRDISATQSSMLSYQCLNIVRGEELHQDEDYLNKVKRPCKGLNNCEKQNTKHIGYRERISIKIKINSTVESQYYHVKFSPSIVHSFFSLSLFTWSNSLDFHISLLRPQQAIFADNHDNELSIFSFPIGIEAIFLFP